MADRLGFRLEDVDPALNVIAADIVDAAGLVRKAWGAGLLERPYRMALERELTLRGHAVSSEVPATVGYRGLTIQNAYFVDLLVDGRVIVEVKATADEHPAHLAQVQTYLRLSGHPLAFLVNFHAQPFASGIRRFANTRRPT